MGILGAETSGARRPAERARSRRRWGLALFSLPFTAVGIGVLAFLLVPWLADGLSARTWHQGEAHLSGAGLRVSAGDDATTYRAWARYTYVYAGREYSGERVALDRSGDNIGDFQQKLGRTLERAFEDGRPVPVWIDPDDPSVAVLNRDLRWGKLALLGGLAVAFSGIGLGLLWLALRARAGPSSGAKPAAGEPWLARPEWAGPEIGSGARAVLAFAWSFTALWNAVAVPAGVICLREFLGGDERAAFGLVFPVIGVGLLAWALKETAAWLRFGRTMLVMDPYPGAIGGQVGGTLDLGIPYDAGHRFRVSLSCLHSRITGSGKNRRRSESVVWHSEGYAHAVPRPEGTRLEMLFDVDGELPSSEPRDREAYHLWRLHVEADLPGADFDRSFELPVFPTGAHARALRRLSTEHPAARQERASAIGEVLDVQTIPGGVELYYPAFRRPRAKLVMLLVGLVFAGVFVFTAGTDAPLPLRVVFGAVGAALTLGSLYSLCVSLRVRIDSSGLRTRRRLLGLPAGGHSLRRDAIGELALKQSYSTSAGGRHTVYYKLQVRTRAGRAITVGWNLAGRDTALQALDGLSRLTGIPMAGAATENALA